MKDIIRMNQLAGIITEGQAKKMLETLNEEENNTLTQEDFNILKDKGFEVYLNTKHNFIWLERKYGLKKADFKYLNNLLVKKDIPFEVKYWRGDGDRGQSKEIWIDKKYITQ